MLSKVEHILSSESIQKISEEIKPDIQTYIHKALYIGPYDNPETNDFLNTNLENIIQIQDGIKEGGIVQTTDGTSYIVKYNEEEDIGCLDFFNPFTEKEEDNKRRYLLFSNVYSEEEYEVIMRLGQLGITRNLLKVWINGEAVFNQSQIWNDTYLVFLKLKQGNNIICAEIDTASAVSIKIDPVRYLLDRADGYMIEEYIKDQIYNQAEIISPNGSCGRDMGIDFSLLKRDLINICDEKYDYALRQDDETLLLQGESYFGEAVHLDISGCNPNHIFLHMEAKYMTKDGMQSFSHTFLANRKKYDAVYDTLSAQHKTSLQERHLDRQYALDLEGLLRDMDFEKGPLKLNFFFNENARNQLLNALLKKADRIMECIEKKIDYATFLERETRSGGTFHIYYLSKIDGTLQKYIISIPYGYHADRMKTKKKYPLVIFNISNANTHHLTPSKTERLLNSDVFILTMDSRGVTMGSYAGEAAFFEVFHDIIGKYEIDMNRIFLQGFCASAYTAWSLAQTHPYLFAGLSCFGGMPNLDLLCNIEHMDVYYLLDQDESSKEMKKAFHLLKETHGDSHVMVIRDTLHTAVLPYYFSGSIMDRMICRKEKRPSNMKFRTHRMIHNKSDWFEVIRFSSHKTDCQIEGQITNTDQKAADMDIQVQNIDAFSISRKIPALAAADNKKQMIINIYDADNQAHSKIKIESASLKRLPADPIFIKENGCFKIEQNRNTYGKEKQQSDHIWGLGLLYVYMDALQILIPSEWDTEPEAAVIKETAESFGSPSYMSESRQTYFSYPILTDHEQTIVGKTADDTGNIIYICTEKQFNPKVIGKCELNVLPAEDGFLYQGKFHEGDYCILQLVNDVDNGRAILVVCANHPEMLKKCIFTRKVVLPTYASGIHPFWNNQILVLSGDKYYGVFQAGGEMRII